MATNKNLRSEIQALRNQAKARGHKDFVSEEDIKEKAFVQNEASKSAHKYVYSDLLTTFIFLLFALILLFVASLKLSSFTQLDHIRAALHITKISF